MILPIHALVRSPHGRGRRPPLRHSRRRPGAGRDRRSSRRRAARSAISPCRSPSSSRAGCARRRASIAQEIAGALGTVDGFARIEAAPNGYVNFFLDRAGVPARVAARRRRPAARRPATRRSSSTRRSTRTRRRTSATCATPRSATRSAGCCAFSAARRNPELHRRHRRAGRRRRGRLPRARAQDARRGPRDRRHRRASTTTAGTSTRASPSGTSGDKDAAQDPREGAPRHRARRQRHRRPRPLHRRSHRPRAT